MQWTLGLHRAFGRSSQFPFWPLQVLTQGRRIKVGPRVGVILG